MKWAGYESLLLVLLFSACVDPLARPTGRLGRYDEFASEAERSSWASRGSRAPAAVSYTTIEEILQRPTLFHQRWVRLKGRIAEVRFSPVQRGRSTVIAIVYLSDRVGNAVEVAIEEDVPLREGQEVTVEGKAVLLPTAPARTVDIVITAAHIVNSLSDKRPATIVRTPKAEKGAPPKGSPLRKTDPTQEDEEGRIF